MPKNIACASSVHIWIISQPKSIRISHHHFIHSTIRNDSLSDIWIILRHIANKLVPIIQKRVFSCPIIDGINIFTIPISKTNPVLNSYISISNFLANISTIAKLTLPITCRNNSPTNIDILHIIPYLKHICYFFAT